ncbi:MAG: polysaccharide deacetylase family protein, partial [Fervidobacterium sp.]
KAQNVTSHERWNIYSAFPQVKDQDVTTETTKTESVIESEKKDNANDEIFFTKARTNEKIIFITIDDGPGNYTPQILDLLKEYNIKAIFFVSGDTVLGYQEHLKREYEEGHSIGSHTYCHRSYYKLQKTADLEILKQTLRSDIEKTEENIKKIIPEIKIRYLRMPEGYSKDWVKEIAKEYGYKIINWTAGYDWLQEPVEQTIERYKKSLKPGGIYLFHDGKDRGLKTIKILSELIPYALSQGYKFGDPKDYF